MILFLTILKRTFPLKELQISSLLCFYNQYLFLFISFKPHLPVCKWSTVIVTSQQGAHKLEQNKTILRYSWRKRKGVFSLSFLLEGVIHLHYFCPILILRGATEVYEHDRNDVLRNPSRQLITTNWEIRCFQSLVIKKKKHIYFSDHTEKSESSKLEAIFKWAYMSLHSTVNIKVCPTWAFCGTFIIPS